MKKDYYIYPAIFNYEDKEIAISFPDLPGCYSCGKDDEDALYMAKDALGLYIVSAEEDGEELKKHQNYYTEEMKLERLNMLN